MAAHRRETNYQIYTADTLMRIYNSLGGEGRMYSDILYPQEEEPEEQEMDPASIARIRAAKMGLKVVD